MNGRVIRDLGKRVRDFLNQRRWKVHTELLKLNRTKTKINDKASRQTCSWRTERKVWPTACGREAKIPLSKDKEPKEQKEMLQNWI